VNVESFREHVERLADIGTFVTPSAIDQLDQLADDRLHFLLTFDDGYVNNLRLAAPVLEQCGAPALFFISTHHLVSGEAFWFDRIATRIQAAHVTKMDLSPCGLREYVFHPSDGSRRWDDINRLLSDLKDLGNADHPVVARVLDVIEREYGEAAKTADQEFRPLTLTELRDLAGRPRMFFGSHGHRHDILTHLDDGSLAESLSESKRTLEQLLGTRIDAIAYPNGNHDDRVRRACTAAGYRRGYATTHGLVPRDLDDLAIPRVSIGGYEDADDVVATINSLLLTDAISSSVLPTRRRPSGNHRPNPRGY
jgi:peptidoglycan/xylan/chitin deacetylase (PgdA/CDA1 family)